MNMKKLLERFQTIHHNVNFNLNLWKEFIEIENISIEKKFKSAPKFASLLASICFKSPELLFLEFSSS
jgi:hypothetical protein